MSHDITYEKSCTMCGGNIHGDPEDMCQQCLTIVILSEEEISIDKYDVISDNDIAIRMRERYLTHYSITKRQLEAIRHAENKARQLSQNAREEIFCKLIEIGRGEEDLYLLEKYIRDDAPLIIHVHLARYLTFLMNDTHYRNQFETGFSSGCKDIIARKSWEQRMFGTAYDDAEKNERVKYGTINIWGYPNGVPGAREYGSSYLLLKKHMRHRCTFTGGDSSRTGEVATCTYFFHILNRYSKEQLDDLCYTIFNAKMGVEDNGYKEMQIHGDVQLNTDIEAIFVSQLDQTNENVQKMLGEFSIKNQINIIYME